MSVEFETVAIDPQVAADILNKVEFLRRELRCFVQITAPVGARAWHVSIRCPTTGLLFGEMARTLQAAWERVSEDWFRDMQKKVPGITRERVGL